MKKFIFLIISVILLFGFAFIESRLYHNTITGMQTHLSELEIIVNSNSENIATVEIIDKYEDIKDDWEKSEGPLIMLTDYIQLEQIGISLARMEVNIKENNTEDCKEEINIIRHICEILTKRIEVNFENIL